MRDGQQQNSGPENSQSYKTSDGHGFVRLNATRKGQV